FLRASPHPSAGIARLSQHLKSLNFTPTNAKCRSSSVSVNARDRTLESPAPSPVKKISRQDQKTLANCGKNN
ncbi:MAG: hypothetical protein MPJ79_04030, partial [Alphaproteobacteria bacterium]|nr:hypothetical protein [Alphaproteobacteria bacterium]